LFDDCFNLHLNTPLILLFTSLMVIAFSGGTFVLPPPSDRYQDKMDAQLLFFLRVAATGRSF